LEGGVEFLRLLFHGNLIGKFTGSFFLIFQSDCWSARKRLGGRQGDEKRGQVRREFMGETLFLEEQPFFRAGPNLLTQIV
jgi:hypothetical protein